MEFLDISKKPDLTDISAIIEKFRNGELKDGSPITVRGTLHRIKEMSGFAFVNVRSPRLVFQCVWDAERSECDIKDFSVEECVEIEGTIVAEERSKLGFDVHIKSMKRLSGRADVLPVEVGNDRKIEKLNLNTLLDHRVITLRNPRVRAIMKVDGRMSDLFARRGLYRICPPEAGQGRCRGRRRHV